MQIIIYFLFTFITLSFPLVASAGYEENENFCIQISEYAYTVMDLRQKGMYLSKQLELSAKITEDSNFNFSEDVAKSILLLNKQIILNAYNEKIQNTQAMQKKVSENYRIANLKSCLNNIK